MIGAALAEDAERFRVELDPCAVVVGVTGHRPPRLGATEPGDRRRYWLREQLITRLRELGATLLWSGGSQGAEEDACRVAIHTRIPFRLALPFPGFDESWPEEARKRAKKIRSQARSVEYVSKGRPSIDHEETLYLEANVALVRRVEHLIVIWDGGPGRTEHAVRAAAAIGRPWTWIDPTDYRGDHGSN